MAGPALELAIDLGELRQAMRRVYENPDEARERGLAAGRKVREQFTWARTAQTMAARLRMLAAQAPKSHAVGGGSQAAATKKEILVSACLAVRRPVL